MKTAIVGDSVKRRHMVLWIIAGAVLLVLAIAGGIALRMALSDDHDQVKTATPTLPAGADKAQELSTTGDYAGAHKQLDDALSQAGLSVSDKYALYYQQGTTFANEANYAQAIDSYKKAEALQTTQSLAESMGDAYAAQGTKDQAIAAYKKAIQLAENSDNPVQGDDKIALEQKIRDLGGQP